MQRRTLLRLGLAGTALVALAGTVAVAWKPGLVDGKLSPQGRSIFGAIAKSVLDGMLPEASGARTQMLAAHLERVNATVAALSPAARTELSQLLGVLATLPGRRWLAGLETEWDKASVAQVDQALQGMRFASNALRQQTYHALRDLTNAAFVSVPEGWQHLGYPGPADV